MSPSEVLNKAADLIETKGWCQYTYAKARNGRMVDFDHPGACKFCMLGAIKAVRGDTLIVDTLLALEKSLGVWVARYNDTPGRTKQEVIDALRKAAEVAK